MQCKKLVVFSVLFCAFVFPCQGVMAKAYGARDILDPAMHNICALTFDDGPHPRTLQVLEALKEENVKATFFVLGVQLKYFPEIAQRIHEEGHEIANHAYSHMPLSSLSIADIRDELETTNEMLHDIGISRPRFVRPPLGAYNKQVLAVIEDMEMDLVLWSTDSYDWQGRPDYYNMPNMANEAMTSQTQRGIYLFHDTKLVTATDAKRIVSILREIGCENFVTVSEYFMYQESPQMLSALREKKIHEKSKSIQDQSQEKTLVIK